MAANKSLSLALGIIPNTVSLRKKQNKTKLLIDGSLGLVWIHGHPESLALFSAMWPLFSSLLISLSLLWVWCHRCFMPTAPCIQLALTLLLAPALPCFRARLSLLFPTSLAPSPFLVSGQAQIHTDKLEVWVWRNKVWADIHGCNTIHQFLPCPGHRMDNILSSKGNSFLSLYLHYTSISHWQKMWGWRVILNVL